MEKRVWYKRPWGILIAILFLPYFALWYMWAKSQWSTQAKVLVTVLASIPLVLVGFAGTSSPQTQLSTQAIKSQSSARSTATPSPSVTASPASSTTPTPSVSATPSPTPAASAQPTTQAVDCPNGTYINSAGNTVCNPYSSSSAPAGATAQCNDGSYSFSQSHSGTCSHHGGVATWL